MKKVFVFLSGFFIALLIVIAGVFIYLTKSNGVNSTDSFVTSNSNDKFITFSSEVFLPPGIKINGDQSKGILEASLAIKDLNKNEAQRFVPFSVIRIIAPKFPVKIKLKALIKDLTYPGPGGFLMLHFSYTPSGAGTSSGSNYRFDPARTDDLFTGGTQVPVSSEQLVNGAIPPETDIGRAYLGLIFPPYPRTACSSGKVLLAGKITPLLPSADWRNKKIAMVVFPATHADGKDIISEKEFAESVFHYQFLDFSNGAATFSIPALKHPAKVPFMRLRGIACGATEELKACAMRVFPTDIQVAGRVLPIFAKNFYVPFCGLNNFDGYIIENAADLFSPEARLQPKPLKLHTR
jgi:hypothetical protein